MKKTRMLTLLLIAAIVVAVCVWVLPAQAHAANNGYYTYEVSDDKVTITACDISISGNITIPSTLGGYPVTSIGEYAFQNCSSLTSVNIPNGVTSIGKAAFAYCANLSNIAIPDSVASVGTDAFVVPV